MKNTAKVSQEELEKSLRYLDDFQKGKESEQLESKEPEKSVEKETEEEQEPDDKLYQEHKKRMSAYIDKAYMHKGILDKIKKGEPLPDEAFILDDEEEKKPAKPAEKEPEQVEKGQNDQLGHQNIDELVKAKVDAGLESIQKSFNDKLAEIEKNYEEKLNAISSEPVRKTILKGAETVVLKKALSGEKSDEGKTILSVSLQKGQVSNALMDAYNEEKDSMRKGQLGEAIMGFEASGGYISPEIAQMMYDKGIQIIK